MGIDARIAFKLKGSRPTDNWVRTLSWAICAALGADKFFIQDGLSSDEYKVKSAEWHAAWKVHSVSKELDALPKTHGSNWHAPYPGDKRGRNYRDMIVADIGEFKFKERQQAIEFTDAVDAEENEGQALPAGKHMYQDGDPLIVGEDEWLLKVSVWTRYYGPGYERGDILFICAVAEWLEANVPGCAVYYGGDSSGVCAEPFDAKARDELRRHFYSPAGRDYFKHDYGRAGRKQALPSPCGLCKPTGADMSNFGGGGDIDFVHCAGCGKSFEGNAKIGWTERKKDEF